MIHFAYTLYLICMEQTPLQATTPQKHSPLLCALSHLLIFGGAYLYLRLYKRFFLFFATMILLGFIPVAFTPFVVLFGAMIDTYLQTQGINEGKIQKEPFNNAKHIGGTILIILAVVASLVGLSPYLAWR